MPNRRALPAPPCDNPPVIRALTLAAVVVASGAACGKAEEAKRAHSGADEAPVEPTAVSTDWAAAARERMVEEQIAARGIEDERVLAAMSKVPRHEFIPGEGRDHAYEDHPVPIGHDQTISQPYIVAIMVQLADLDEKSRVLEIGTGSGYTAAILAEVASEVYTIEIVKPLAQRAKAVLERLGYENVHARAGDGYGGWPDAAPFDAILVTAAPSKIPTPLKDQLREGGRLVIPVGDQVQELRVLTRTASGFEERSEFPVRFVPMVGQAQGD
jgi:protein-L-isoaspartate(D-aspartate) O-methyltransferase